MKTVTRIAMRMSVKAPEPMIVSDVWTWTSYPMVPTDVMQTVSGLVFLSLKDKAFS